MDKHKNLITNIVAIVAQVLTLALLFKPDLIHGADPVEVNESVSSLGGYIAAAISEAIAIVGYFTGKNPK